MVEVVNYEWMPDSGLTINAVLISCDKVVCLYMCMPYVDSEAHLFNKLLMTVIVHIEFHKRRRSC